MKLAPVFADGMLLQHDAEIRVFGESDGPVTVTFLGETRRAGGGNFILRFSPHPAGGPYEMQIEADGRRRVIRDIMIGEVIMLAGQSNAELPVSATSGKDTDFGTRQDVRLFVSARPMRDEEGHLLTGRDPMGDKWCSLSPENVKNWPALGLYTALYYAKKTGMAVGIVGCYKGASAIRAFLPAESYAAFAPDEEKIHKDHRLYPWNTPGYLYETMFRRVFPFSVSKLVWYQGESNRTEYEGQYYDRMLSEWVKIWRAGLEHGNLPLAIVQINRYIYETAGVEAIRQAQERAIADIPNAALVRIDDLGEHDEIHPTRKDLVAERIVQALDGLGSQAK